MRKRTIAVATSIATLSLAAAPFAAASTDKHRSPDKKFEKKHHVEKSSRDHSRDLKRDR